MQREDYNVIGKKFNKVEAVEKALGHLKYAGDIYFQNCLYAKVLRSPHAHAIVKRINTSKAEKLKGVKAVITHKDVPKIPTWHNALYVFSAQCFDSFILEEKVRHVGDRVAAVAAVSPEIAEEALELIEVEYQLLSAVFDRIKAMEEDSPTIHDFVWRGSDKVKIKNNILATREIKIGDVEKGFKEADIIVENIYETSRPNNAPLERSVITCCPGPGGSLEVYATTQGVHTLRMSLAGSLGIPLHLINVHRVYLGGSFGAHIHTGFIESICALLALKTQRPVRLEKTRKEIFLSCGRHPETIKLKTGVKKDGTLVAQHMDLTDDTGAYATGAESKMVLGAGDFMSMYQCPNQRFTGRTVYTNTPPLTAMRGAGNPQVHFAVESQMDIIAEQLMVDPIELRLRNLIKIGDKMYGAGHDIFSRINSNGTQELMIKGAEIIGWSRRGEVSNDKSRLRRGIGFARGFHTSGCGSEKPSGFYVEYSGAIVMINIDGSVNLITASVDSGSGGHTVYAGIVAEELGVRFEDVVVSDADTQTAPFDCPTHASRGTYVVGMVSKEAAKKAKEILLKWASEILEEPVNRLQTKEGKVYVVDQPERWTSIEEVVLVGHRNGWGSVIGLANLRPTECAPHFTVAFCEVEVDTQTGKVCVVRYIAGADVGTVINRNGVEGQIVGGVHMGLGYALLEDTKIDETNGEILTTNFTDYKILSPIDMPPVETIIADTFEPTGPFGAKGSGEGVTNPVAPAVCNAVYNAIRVRIKDLPITPEKILKALRKKSPNH